MPLNDPAPSRRWLDSLSRSRERRRAAALRRRRRRMGRVGSTVLFVSLACTGGAALAQQSSESTGSLRTGSTGIAVEALQQALGIEADGHYGPKTARAGRRFQRRNDLPVTGVAGPGTLRALGLHTAAAVTQPGDSTGQSDDVEATLARIAECESGSDPTAVSASGHFRGKYQFTVETWRDMGGEGDPAEASEAEQDRRAAQLLEARGTAPWPVCGRNA